MSIHLTDHALVAYVYLSITDEFKELYSKLLNFIDTTEYYNVDHLYGILSTKGTLVRPFASRLLTMCLRLV